ncbi:hypothetical protein EBL87_12700 [Cereibacter sphaeroides]|uniref:hypothetical protein n=1 Tax=Cereibacter sphaeroides TaxID=1063 RepID=UPI000F521599|nr:hypothetical protein [Cereibacter sphaeroides]AZB64564.1 hypothetical protein EBL87_12700 [Cereibacter sphaeroides]AZB67502.1 hypothetical protein EBL86_03550 [Cereibacter sphaeroides]
MARKRAAMTTATIDYSRLVKAADIKAQRDLIPAEISLLQAMIVIGEEKWAEAMAIAEDASYPWAMRAAIRGATMLVRDSETMDTLAFLLGLSPEETDRLFVEAAEVTL